MSIEAALRAAAADFGEPARAGTPPVLRWGPLFVALCEGSGVREDEDGQYAEAIELIYEGYLFHYRESRVRVLPRCERETGLLAGDVLYARGLRMIAAHGDVASVELLTRLMAACSDLRAVAAPFAADDALWAYTMAAMAAARGRGRGSEYRDGTSPVRAGKAVTDPKGVSDPFFAALDEALGRGVSAGVPERAAEAAASLGLPGAGPLAAAFAGILEEARRGTAPTEGEAPPARPSETTR